MHMKQASKSKPSNSLKSTRVCLIYKSTNSIITVAQFQLRTISQSDSDSHLFQGSVCAAPFLCTGTFSVILI